jgi:hypothetical protein
MREMSYILRQTQVHDFHEINVQCAMFCGIHTLALTRVRLLLTPPAIS